MIDTMATPSTGIVQRYFEAMEKRDGESFAALFADDVTETIPYNSSGETEPQAVFTGKTEVLGYVDQILTNFSQTRMQDKTYTANADDSIVFCEARGDLVAAKDSKPYLNIYVFRFDLKDGRICAIREYANPVTFSKMMGLPPGVALPH